MVWRKKVKIVEVGPRDGLQNESGLLTLSMGLLIGQPGKMDSLLTDIGWSIANPNQHAAVDWQTDASDEAGLLRCKEDGRVGDVPARAHPAA